MTTPNGCLSALVIVALIGWSLLVGGVLAFGWMGTEIVGAAVGLIFGETDAARQTLSDVTGFLRTLGFGVLALIWALGAVCLVGLWFMLARLARALPERGGFDLGRAHTPAPRQMKDVTPARGSLPPPDSERRARDSS
jgi:hypothetical protein